MAQVFNCPSCGAPLEYDGGADQTIECKYCHSSVIVPEELRTSAPSTLDRAPFSSAIAHAKELAAIAQLARAGKKIDAIKLYRATFGGGLKEAKDAVENIAEGKPIQFSQLQSETQINVPTSPVSSSRLGCWIAAFVIFMVGITALPPLIATGVLAAVFGHVFGHESSIVALVATPTHALAPTRTPILSATRAFTPTPGFANVALKFGGSGTGPGLFTDARSVAVDNAGNIYVGEYTGGRIQVFDSTGKFDHLWLIDAKAPLHSLAADRKGVVYVSQNGAIVRYDGATGKLLGQLEYPEGNRFDAIATTADGGLLAMWYEAQYGIITSIEGHRDDLVKFDAAGKVVWTVRGFLSAQTGDPELDTQIAVDGLGNIYALGGMFAPAVFCFSPEGKYVNRFGSRGDAPGQFRSTAAIAVDNQSRVYVADVGGVVVFDKNGRYLDTFKVDGSASGLAFNDKNELFVTARTQVFKYIVNKP